MSCFTYIIMDKSILALAVFTILILTQNITECQITPIIPPTAFVNQFYSSTFRVIGVPDAKLTFSNLPTFFAVSQGNTVSGVPNRIGTYTITIEFKGKNNTNGKQDVVFQVISSTKRQNKSLQATTNYSQAVIYQVGKRLTIDLRNLTGHQSSGSWSYVNLPLQLKGSVNGILHGTFNLQGYYTFIATFSDTSGMFIDYFFTLNIQPVSSKSLRDVPIRNRLAYSMQYIQKIQEEALKEQQKAMLQANRARQNYSALQMAVKQAQSYQQLVEFQYVQVQNATRRAAQTRNRFAQSFNKAARDLQNSQRNYNISFIALTSSINATRRAIKISNQAVQEANDQQNIKNMAILQYKNAQDAHTLAIISIKSLYQQANNAQNDASAAFFLLAQAKKQVNIQKFKLSATQWNASQFTYDKQISSLKNDQANQQLQQARIELKSAQRGLQFATNSVLQIRNQMRQAQRMVQSAQFNLTQANNRLFVAQAAKEQSDKSMNIASAQLTSSILTINQPIFDGCTQGNYPSIFGSAQITKVGLTSYQLDSGYRIFFGECTSMVLYKQGDMIQFDGYLKGGAIQAISILPV